MTAKYKILKRLLKSRILLSTLLLLISFSSFSQTTTDTTKKICIPIAKATQIARDLTAYHFLKVEDSILNENIRQYKMHIQLDSMNASLLQQKITIQRDIITDLNSKDSLQINITNQYKKQATVYKWERNGAIVVAIIAIVKLAFK